MALDRSARHFKLKRLAFQPLTYRLSLGAASQCSAGSTCSGGSGGRGQRSFIFCKDPCFFIVALIISGIFELGLGIQFQRRFRRQRGCGQGRRQGQSPRPRCSWGPGPGAGSASAGAAGASRRFRVRGCPGWGSQGRRAGPGSQGPGIGSQGQGQAGSRGAVDTAAAEGSQAENRLGAAESKPCALRAISRKVKMVAAICLKLIVKLASSQTPGPRPCPSHRDTSGLLCAAPRAQRGSSLSCRCELESGRLGPN